jgi:ribonuclease-3
VARVDDITRLTTRLDYDFARPDLLERALTHKSFSNEHADLQRSDNERLEFLGDAVLDLVVGHMLIDAHPGVREGELSIMRAQIVSEPGLAVIARELELGSFLFLGKGESQTGGRDKPSLLADALEAVIAAVYLDGGFEAARRVVASLFEGRLQRLVTPGFSDYKTRLQERAQALYKEPPRYELVNEVGPDHDKTFEIAVVLQNARLASATGKSKKEAEQGAAKAALEAMGEGEDLAPT